MLRCESSVANLFESVTFHRFVEHYLGVQPFALAGAAEDFVEFGAWKTLRHLLAQPGVDVLAVKDNQRWSGNHAPDIEEAETLYRQGYTILVRHAERLDEHLRQIADEFKALFGAAVDVHLYFTPAGGRGFGWHYDAEEVFILQAAGKKEYSLRKNTVNPWPVAEALPADMQYEREIMPLSRCLLHTADWLYIPSGYWHCAKALENSVSIAVGITLPTALDVIDRLRQELVNDLRWRQRLPLVGQSTESLGQSHSRLKELFCDLAKDLQRRILDQRFQESFLSSSHVESQSIE